MDINNFNERAFVVPSDIATREALEQVDKMTMYDLADRFGYNISYNWQCNTIAYIGIETILYHLSTAIKTSGIGIGKGMEFGDILIIKATNKVDDDAEKSGNINVSFIPHTRVKEILINDGKDDYDKDIKLTAEDLFHIEDGEDSEDYIQLDKYSKYALSKNYNITLSTSTPLMSQVILYVFLENLFRKVYSMYKNQIEEGEERALASINFNDLLEVHCTTGQDNKPMISIRPGVMAKLNIKSDDVTEEE